MTKTKWANHDMHGRTACVFFEVEGLSSVPRDVRRSSDQLDGVTQNNRNMSGTTAFVFLRRAFTPADSGDVTDLLRRHADDVKETRKGRHWTFIVANAEISLSVLNTAAHRYDFEDDLIDNDLNCDDAPEAFVLAFPTRRECDRDKCNLLSQELAKRFGGIVGRKQS